MVPNVPRISDTWLRASWRARPGSFVALMSLYESNRVRLGVLLGDARRLHGRYLSRLPGEPDLELVVREQGAYTTVLELNHLFDAEAYPDLEVRAYHDSDLAESSRLDEIGRAPV